MFRCIQVLTVIVSVGLTGCQAHYDCTTLAAHGQLTVEVRDLEVPDAARGFSVKSRIYAPEPIGADTLLVLVSTGLGATLSDFEPLARTLAASNYAVAVIEHRVSTTDYVCAPGASPVDCWHTLEHTEEHPENWDERFADTALLMNELPRVLGVDGKHIALVGHSFGSFTMMAFGGTTYVDPRSEARKDLRDPRVVSVVAMSPSGPRWLGLDGKSWDTIDRPLYLLTGDKDGTTMVDDTPEWRRESWPHMRGGDKLLLRIDTGEHMSFTSKEKNRSVTDLVTHSVLAFIDGTLRKRDNAAALTPEAVKTCSSGHASLERR